MHGGEFNVDPELRTMSAQFLDQRHSLMAFIRGIVRDNDVAEDIFQEVWLQLAETIEKNGEVRDLPKWCRGTARNLVLRHWQKKKGQKVIADSSFLQHVETSFQEQEATRSYWDSRRDALRQCIEGLPATQKEILQLRYDAQLPIQTIAERVQKSVASIMMMLSRMRRAMAKCADQRLKPDAVPHS
jgi:RNA polymerase sigma-70 factor, ECF subfamily